MKGHILVLSTANFWQKTHTPGIQAPRTIKSAQFSAVIADILHP